VAEDGDALTVKIVRAIASGDQRVRTVNHGQPPEPGD
jgi:hypothetical protein